MALVGLGVISIFKCKRHYKSRDIGESCTERTEPVQKMMIGELSLPLGKFMFVVLFMYFHEVSLQIASLGRLATAGDNSQTTSVQITHVFFVFVLFYTPNLCTTTQHEENMRNLYWCSLARVTSNHSA